jgi:CHAD domain-containing protein
MPAATTRSTLLRHRLDRFNKTLKGVEQGDVRALHRARVASRRLRELLPTLQFEHASTAHKVGRKLRKITRRLGGVRELDVLLSQLDDLHADKRNRSGALGRVGLAVSRERDAARKRLLERLPVGDIRRVAKKLETLCDELAEAEAAGSRGAERSWRWVVEARVARRASHLVDAMKEAGAVYLPERLHAARIAMKKLRYAAEIGVVGGGEPGDQGLKLLARGQELLGRMHDAQVLIDRVRQLQASLTPPNVAVWRELDALVISLEDDCRRLHGRYMRSRDAIFALAEGLSGTERGHARAAARSRAS